MSAEFGPDKPPAGLTAEEWEQIRIEAAERGNEKEEQKTPVKVVGANEPTSEDYYQK